MDALLEDSAKLKAVLSCHVIAGHVSAKDMKSGEVMTLQGSPLTAVVSSSEVKINGVHVRRAELRGAVISVVTRGIRVANLRTTGLAPLGAARRWKTPGCIRTLFDQRYGFGEVRPCTAHARMLDRLQTGLRLTQILQYVLMVRTIGIVEHGGCEVQVDQLRLDDIAVRTCGRRITNQAATGVSNSPSQCRSQA
jgi:hypothetical protein